MGVCALRFAEAGGRTHGGARCACGACAWRCGVCGVLWHGQGCVARAVTSEGGRGGGCGSGGCGAASGGKGGDMGQAGQNSSASGGGNGAGINGASYISQVGSGTGDVRGGQNN